MTSESDPMTSPPMGPTPRVAPRPRCALCDGEGVVLHAEVPDHYFGVPGRWSLKRCENRMCGLVWQDPMVIEEDLARAYQSYYTHGADATDPSGLRPNVFNAHFYRLDRWFTKLLGLQAERRRFALSYLEDFTPGSVLDVGCGSGSFTELLQRRGWVVRGAEFDPAAAAAAREAYGIQVDVGDLTKIGYADESFDAVTVRHVIEHVREPIRFLAECWRILKPGGHLVFITPNIGSLGHRHFRSRWRGLEQPRHLFLFDARSMTALFIRADIAPVEVFSSPQGGSYVLAESYRTSDGLIQRLFDYPAIWWLYLRERALTKSGKAVGEELVALASKPSSYGRTSV